MLNRILDTFIGIIVGLAVNDFHFPYRQGCETLYVSGIDSVLISEDDLGGHYSKVELNRLIENGVQFTISTIHTPSEVISLMKGVQLKLPLIVMDGAAMYDLNKKEYLETEFLRSDICEAAERIIAENGMNCFVDVMYDTTLLIFYGNLKNTPEKEIFEKHRHSPYRNYVREKFRRHDATERVLYLTVIDTNDKIAALADQLKKRIGGMSRITVADSEYDGYRYLKIFSPLASKQEMMKKLKEHTGAEKTVTFGSVKGEYDVYINDGGGNATVKKIKRLYRNGMSY